MAQVFWDQRFGGDEFLFGPAANEYVTEICSQYPPTEALDLGCGEGRNAVWLAEQGHTVTGVDVSPVGLVKAERLAHERNVAVNWVRSDLAEYEPIEHAYGLIVLSYIHIEPELRTLVHGRAGKAVAPGGHVVVVGHHLRNLAEGIGGPQNPAILLTESMLAEDFADVTILRNETVERAVPGDERTALDLVFVATT